MKILSGKVVAGRIEIEGESLGEGSAVTVLAREADEMFEVNEAQERALLAAIAEADRGDVIEASEAMRQLKQKR